MLNGRLQRQMHAIRTRAVNPAMSTTDSTPLSGDKTNWWEAPLDTLNKIQWEALCDGCGRCCLVKLRDADDDSLHFTSLVCHLFDRTTARCTDYSQRHVRVPDCIEFDAADLRSHDWLPNTCAYRLRADGKPLPEWHPLISGDPASVEEAGISVKGRVVSEANVHPDDAEEFIIRWVSAE